MTNHAANLTAAAVIGGLLVVGYFWAAKERAKEQERQARLARVRVYPLTAEGLDRLMAAVRDEEQRWTKQAGPRGPRVGTERTVVESAETVARLDYELFDLLHDEDGA